MPMGKKIAYVGVVAGLALFLGVAFFGFCEAIKPESFSCLYGTYIGYGGLAIFVISLIYNLARRK